MIRYRKKPVIVETVQFNGKNRHEIEKFMNQSLLYSIDGDNQNNEVINIKTLSEGIIEAKKGDYIIKGIKGEFYPYKPDIFKKTYELVEDKEDK